MRLIQKTRCLVVILLSFFWLNLAYAQAPAGQVIVVTGSFQAQQADQKLRPLARGSYFYSGDTLITGKESTAQVRFTDGTVTALYPNSELRINDYVYQSQDKQQNRSVTTLVKGGFRALTGLISKENPEAYQARTPVAVIGVRGTNFGAVLDKGKLYAGVWKGGIYVKNEKGLIKLGQGDDYQFATVTSATAAPIGLLNPPQQLVGQCGVR